MSRRYQGPWIPAALLEDRAERFGDDTAVVTPSGERLSHGELAGAAARFARGLSGLGVEAGDRVATMLLPEPTYLGVWFATSWAGAVEVPINTDYKGQFLLHVLRQSRSSVLVMDSRWVDRLAGLELPELRHVVLHGERIANVPTGATVHHLDDWACLDAAPLRDASEYEATTIMYTSGTTGVSKGVVHSNRSALRNTASAVDVAELSDQDVAYSFFPLFHVTARAFVVCATLWTGGRVLLRERLSLTDFWRDARRFGITWFPAMGSVLQMLLTRTSSEEARGHDIRLVCAGAVPAGLRERFVSRFGVEILDIYGLTETGVVTSQRLGAVTPGTVGSAMPHFDVEIQDAQGWQLPRGVVGEICVRPRHPHAMFRRYWEQPEATLEAFQDLWFHTGDAGRMTEDGEVVFVDRIKDAIRRRGENISSFEVERVVAAHPDVLECAAYAVPSELGEDEVMVAVVPGDGLDTRQLFRFCVENLPRFAVPRYVRLLDDLPRTPSQRVRKVELREMGLTPDAIDREQLGIDLPRS